MWKTEDTIGLLSCIIGTAWIFVGNLLALFVGRLSLQASLLGLFIGGMPILILGIVAVAKNSKIGIGGIIFGTVYLISGTQFFL